MTQPVGNENFTRWIDGHTVGEPQRGLSGQDAVPIVIGIASASNGGDGAVC